MPEVIPVINCPDAACVEDKLRLIRRALPEAGRVHIDVADGRFTFHKTWNDPEHWAGLRPEPAAEVHLMVEQPELLLPRWLQAGAKRIILHFETVFDPAFRLRPVDPERLWGELDSACRAAGAELMVAMNPETPAERVAARVPEARAFQVLAVHPGLAGQFFLPSVLPKISFLRQRYPDAKIEVDGGVTPETAGRAQQAGANEFASDSFIFRSDDPAAAYWELKAI